MDQNIPNKTADFMSVKNEDEIRKLKQELEKELDLFLLKSNQQLLG